MKNVLAYAIQKSAKTSPKKVAPVMDLIRGKNLYNAKVTLALDTTKAAKMLLKVVKSAEANALNSKIAVDNLYVTELWVGDGPTTKRGRATGRGRHSPILKRTSHIYVGLNERNNK